MVDRRSVLKWAHLGFRDVEPFRSIIAAQRRSSREHVAQIEAEQKERNAALRKLHLGPALQLAERYAAGRPRPC